MGYSQCTCTDHSTDHIGKLIRLGNRLLDAMDDPEAFKDFDQAVVDYVRYLDEHYPQPYWDKYGQAVRLAT